MRRTVRVYNIISFVGTIEEGAGLGTATSFSEVDSTDYTRYRSTVAGVRTIFFYGALGDVGNIFGCLFSYRLRYGICR